MKKLLSISVIIAALALTTSCEKGNLDVVGIIYGQSPRSDERFDNSMEYNALAGYRTINIPTDEYEVYYATDLHVDSSYRNVRKWATLMRNDNNCHFGIILGDIINAVNHYEDFMEGLVFDPTTQAADKPLFATVGNHDLYYGQWSEYLKYWHTSTYYFVAQTPNFKDLFICMDSGDGTWGRKQFDWLKDLLEKAQNENYRHITVFTHTHIFKRDPSQGHTSNFALEETYEIMDVLDRFGVEWYVSGHCHSRDVADFKGVRFIIVDSAEVIDDQPGYMVATFGKELSHRFMYLE